MTLLAYFFLYFVTGFVWRSWVTRRRIGFNPLVLGREDDTDGYVGRAFKGVMLSLAATMAWFAFHPSSLLSWGRLPAVEIAELTWIGWGLLALAWGWMVVAQAHMGSAWRIGIDRQNTTALVQHGLFAVSRNPIFLSMRVALLGLVLVLPHATTLMWALVGGVLMQVQVRLEEAHLASLHGPTYTAYCRQVRRWI